MLRLSRSIRRAAVVSRGRGFFSLVKEAAVAVINIQKDVKELGNQVSNMQKDLKEVQQDVKELQQDLKEVQQDMNARFGSLDARVGSLDARVGSLDARVGSLEYKFGFIMEDQVRNNAAIIFGKSYSKQFTANSVRDLVKLMPDESIKFFGQGDEPQLREAASTQLATKLLDCRADHQLAVFIAENIEVRAEYPLADVKIRNAVKSLRENNFHNSSINVLLGYQPAEEYRSVLLKLKYLHSFESREEKIDAMKVCEGPGVMCTLLQAVPNNKVTPHDCLEMDMRGRVQFFSSSDVKTATVDVGEVKSSLDYSKAVPQLGIRLKVLAFVLRVLVTENKLVAGEFKITLVGRLCVPKKTSRPLVSTERERAATDWDYSLYLHRF